MTQIQPVRNPYIIGRPISEPMLLFGREKQFFLIEENLKQGEQVLLLYGQRRIGKSSLIRNISKFIKSEQFAFVSFDLESHSEDRLEGLLRKLAATILEALNIDTSLILPSNSQFQEQKDIFFDGFLPQIYDLIAEKNLVLLLDEFDALNDDTSQKIENLLKELKNAVNLNKKLFIIIFAGRRSADIPSILEIFPEIPTIEIGLLNVESIKKLIIKPSAEYLQYVPEAIQAIIKLSAGHPYFTQVLCFTIFGRAREMKQWEVTLEDVEFSVDRAVELAEAGSAWYWESLSTEEKVVFSAVAQAQNNDIHPWNLIESYNILSEDLFKKLASELAFKGFLDETGNKVEVELVRLWVLQRHPLWQEIRELEKINRAKITDISKPQVISHSDIPHSSIET